MAVSDGTHPRLLTEVAEAISEALAIILENPWRMRGRGPSGLEMHMMLDLFLDRRRRRGAEES